MNSTNINFYLFIYLILLLKGQNAEGRCPYSACEWWSLCAWQSVNAKYLLDVYKIIFRHSRWWIACKLSLFFDDYVMWMYVHLCHPCTFGVSESGFKATRSAAVRWSEAAIFFLCWSLKNVEPSCPQNTGDLAGVSSSCLIFRWWTCVGDGLSLPSVLHPLLVLLCPAGCPSSDLPEGFSPLLITEICSSAAGFCQAGGRGKKTLPKLWLTRYEGSSVLCVFQNPETRIPNKSLMLCTCIKF